MALVSKDGPGFAITVFVALVLFYVGLSIGISYNRNEHFAANGSENFAQRHRRGHRQSSPMPIVKSVHVHTEHETTVTTTTATTTTTTSTSTTTTSTSSTEPQPTISLSSSPQRQQSVNQTISPFSHGHRMPFLFVHIPKTGGETRIFLPPTDYAFDGILCSSLRRKNNLKCKKTCVCDLYMSKDSQRYWGSFMEQENRLPVLQISIVRNPFERALSWYYFCITGYGPKLELPWPFTVCQAARDLPFSEWVVQVFKTRENQVDWLKGADGEIDWSTTFLIRNENREETTIQALKLIGLKVSSEKLSVRKNPSSWPHGHDYHDYYDDQSREIIATVFAEDMRVLNYTY